MAIHLWEAIDVTSSRLPVLQNKEEIIFVQSHIGLYSGKHKVSEYQDGVLYLTDHRICYVDSTKPTVKSIALELQYIHKIEHFAGFLKSSPKISIRYKTDSASSSRTSGRSTPLPPALVPAKQKSSGDWVCPICTFTNEVGPFHVEGTALPACVNCGMRPPRNTKPSNFGIRSPTPIVKVTSPITKEVVYSRTIDHTAAELAPTLSRNDVSDAQFRCPRCTFANHPAIITCELCGAPLLSRNLPPMLQSNSSSDERSTTPVSNMYGSSNGEESSCKLSFRAAGDKVFLEKLRKALAASVWVQVSMSTTQRPMTDNNVEIHKRAAGISALQIREEQMRTKDADTMSGALEDLEGLMARAQEMIALAESFAKRVAAAPASMATSEAHSLLLESSAALGLSTPVVTKDSVGKSGVFHAELARQIADFLESGRLKKEGGAITLVDLFALYNRARKGDLIGPDDLYSACQQFEMLRLPVILRRFRSGILVVQDRSRDDTAIRRMVINWIRERTLGISALEAAERFGWSVGIAREELEMVEAAGDIVRDIGVEGLQFYENTFGAWDWQKWKDDHLQTDSVV